MMVVRRICALIVGAALVLGTVNAAEAAVLVYIDMDLGTAGIQTERNPVAEGITSFPVGVVMDVTDDAATAYGVSVQFDNTDLTATAAEELLPPEFQFNFTPGVAGILPDIGGGLGQVTTFEAGGFGTGAVAPITEVRLGTIDFDLKSTGDGLAEIMPGFFNSGVDGINDSGSLPREDVQFAGGFVVPEPASMLLLGLGGLALMRRRR